MTNAVIYTRISLDRTGEAAGVARQLEDAKDLANLRGWNVIATHSDNDTSASGRKARPGFEAVLDAVKAGNTKVIVAWSLDRLTRNRRDTVRLIEACQSAAATIALVRGSDMDLSTPAGRMVADILATVARNEIEVKADRQTRATRQAAEAGQRVAGSRPFGFTLRCGDDCAREHKHWTKAGELVVEEADAIRDAYAWLIDGVSLQEIARRWNDRGLTTPARARRGYGNPWRGSTVGQCLRRPGNAGLRAYKGAVVAKHAWPAIVDEETYHAALGILRDPARRTRADRYDVHLLTGIARCGRCGAAVQSGAKHGRLLYVCRHRDLARQGDPIDELVETTMIEALKAPEFARAFTAPTEGTGPSAAELLAEADQLRTRLDALASAFAEGAIELGQLTKGTQRLREQIAAVEARIQSADPVAARVAALASADDVEAVWKATPVQIRRRIIDRLAVVTILPTRHLGNRGFDPATVSVEWRAE